MTINIAKVLAEHKCHASLEILDLLLGGGEITRPQFDALLTGLVPLHEEHNREVAELVRLVCEPPAPAGPPLIHDWDFRDLAPGTLPVGWKHRGMPTWGQDKGRVTVYRGLDDCEWTPEGLVMRMPKTGRKIQGYDPETKTSATTDEIAGTYLTTRAVGGQPAVSIPFFSRVEWEGYWTPQAGLWFALLWLCAEDGGAGRFEADPNEHLCRFGLDRVMCVIHGRLTDKEGTGYRSNLGTRYLRHNSNLVGRGIDWSKPHRHQFEIRPLNGGKDAEFVFGVDDRELVRWTTIELRAAGATFAAGLPERLVLDSTTQAGGLGGGVPIPAAYKGDGRMVLSRVRVWDLTGEAK